MNNLYYIINENAEKILFEPAQREVQTALFNTNHNRDVILKARQHGVTTYKCIDYLDNAMFQDNIRCGIIAHNKDDAQTFFQDKVKFAFDNVRCPELKEKMSPKTDSARELVFSNNSAIRVGTSLRSATLQYLHISEYGKICAKYPEKAKEIRTGALNTVHGDNEITIESTAEGRGGHFYQLCSISKNLMLSDKDLTPMDFQFFFFSWFQKPEYWLDPEGIVIPSELLEYFAELKHTHKIILSDGQKAWYVKKYETQQDEMKREFPSTPDEAFEAAIIGAYYAKQMLKARTDNRISFVPHNPSSQVHTAWDLGINDEMTVWSFQLDGLMVNMIGYYENSGEGLEHYIDYLRSKDYTYGTHFAPHDIKKRDLISGKTRIVRAKEDFDFDFERIDRAIDVVEDINEVRRLFYRFRFDESNCDRGIQAIDSYRKQWDDSNACFKRTPLHNWASNGADGLRTLAHGVLQLTEYEDDESYADNNRYDDTRNASTGY